MWHYDINMSEVNHNFNMSTPNVKDSEIKGGDESNGHLVTFETSGEGNFFLTSQKILNQKF